jgi:predicted TPR repeat methyltransferase
MSSHQSGEADDEFRARRALGYETTRQDVQAVVPLDARRILELGCSSGGLGGALKARAGAYVLGVEIDPEYARQAAGRLDEVVLADAETFLREREPPTTPFDCLVAADVLEHLSDPWNVLGLATAWLAPGATVVVSVPNVLHWVGVWRIFTTARWPRDDTGVFDRTHLRWFTMRDAIELVEGAGLSVTAIRPNYPGRRWRLAIQRILGRTPARRFLAVQWIVVGMKR